ncbi:MAG TPA: hypothetical protein VF223_07025 [Trebonia sp.]|jgi:hypothetical protein
MADYEPDPVSYCPGLRLRAIRFVDENTLEYDFEGVEVEDETFRLSRSWVNGPGIWLYNWDRDFENRYRGMLLHPGAGLERLGSYFFAARRSELPAGASYERCREESQAEAAERWRQDHPDRL